MQDASADQLGVFSQIRDYNDVVSVYNPEANVTSPVMTKYEKAKVLGIRTEQIARGARPMIDVPDNGVTMDGSDYKWTSADIAFEELLQKRTPFVIVRYMPDGTREYWRVRDMIVIRH